MTKNIPIKTLFATLLFSAFLSSLSASATETVAEEHLSAEKEKITATIRQIKSYTAALTTFRDTFNAIPGDMSRAQVRLPHCNAVLCPALPGNGNGRIGDSTARKIELFKDERHLFWVQLANSSLIGGVDNTLSAERAWGSAFPSSPLGGGFQIYDGDDSQFPAASEYAPKANGVYAILSNSLNGDLSEPDAHFLTPIQAAQLDRRIDDGQPLTGSIIAVGDPVCFTHRNGVFQYDEEGAGDKKCLSLYIRLQG
ncbi:MAG: hypothetical protein HND56_05255 [Pseudomonadota bacterium]|jgi:hypothetical protein|nr:hypothetical protein [Pseudomonadota bacterium]QKK05130.1 MAG: hypothetical protein HND56_05255 [Pseudomonadota bacterium]|tara:strand:- start:3416 stop:4177 length:762 start_codon:yes stop_codon:yes gene_type:complete